MVEAVIKPKKRVFIALIGLSAIIVGLFIYMIWEISIPGLANINRYLPYIFGIIALLIVLAFFISILGIVLTILGMHTVKPFYLWAWKTVNLMFPFAVFLGRMFDINRRKIERSFVEVSNHLVRQQNITVLPERILMLTPHCLQLDTCGHKITRDVNNCQMCGCCIGELMALKKKYGVKLVVATGGTLARQLVAKARPKAIIAIACERDLTSGIQDVFPIPVLGVLNERPNGPCFNTWVDISKVEKTINYFINEKEKN